MENCRAYKSCMGVSFWDIDNVRFVDFGGRLGGF